MQQHADAIRGVVQANCRRAAVSLLPGLLFCALLSTVLCLPAGPAQAQEIVARVNGEPITAVEVAQRMRLIQISSQKPPARSEVLDELIEEQLKLQLIRRYRLEIADAEVDSVLNNMGSRMRADPAQFGKMLASSGISVSALKRKLRAEIGWNKIVRGKFESSLQIRDRDVMSALESKGEKDKNGVSYDYTLQPILLITSRSGGDAGILARRREAEGLRTRFQNCDDGLKLARGLRDVAIRAPITRSSGELPAKLRELLDNTAIGKLTPPDITAQGVELFALCGKRVGKGDTGTERDMREALFTEQYAGKAKNYMKQLRRSAMIEMK